MKVYVVIDYFTETVEAVFSSKEKADKYVNKKYSYDCILIVHDTVFIVDAEDNDNEA